MKLIVAKQVRKVYDRYDSEEWTKFINFLWKMKMKRVSGALDQARVDLDYWSYHYTAKKSLDYAIKYGQAYWGCLCCGHEVELEAKECWECETPKHLAWLGQTGDRW